MHETFTPTTMCTAAPSWAGALCAWMHSIPSKVFTFYSPPSKAVIAEKTGKQQLTQVARHIY